MDNQLEQTPDKGEQECREAFEKWAITQEWIAPVKNNEPFSRECYPDGDYDITAVRAAWAAWNRRPTNEGQDGLTEVIDRLANQHLRINPMTDQIGGSREFGYAIARHLTSKREQPAGYVLDAKYEEAIAELAAEKDLSPLQVIKQALKLYQMHEKKFYAGCSPGPVPGYQQPAPQPDAAGLPELPEPAFVQVGVEQGTNRRVQIQNFTAEQMRAYAQQAVAQRDAEIRNLKHNLAVAEVLYGDKVAELTALREQAARDRVDSERYEKLRGWMSINVDEGWDECKRMSAIACYVSWDAFDKYLDDLPECNVGLCEKAAIAKEQK